MVNKEKKGGVTYHCLLALFLSAAESGTAQHSNFCFRPDYGQLIG